MNFVASINAAGFIESLVDAIPANLALLDQAGIIVTVNRAWRDFGRSNACADPAYGIGSDYIGLCRAAAQAGDETAVAVCDGLAQVLDGASPGFTLEYPCHSDESERWFTFLASPLPIDGADRPGAVVMHIDITQRRLAEDRVARESQKRYDFLCSLAHEIRSPLQGMMVFAELMKDAGSVEEFAKLAPHAEKIHASGHHVLDVVDNVLVLAKADAGRQTLREGVVDLRGLTEFGISAVAGLAAQAGVMLNCAGSAQGGAIEIRGDETLLRQALINILSNAIKFTPQGDSIDIGFGLADGAPYVEIIDHGPGMTEAQMAQALEPFGQAGRPLQKGARGTGLGLPLARRFLKLHGGALSMISELGTGTRVRLALPVWRLVAAR